MIGIDEKYNQRDEVLGVSKPRNVVSPLRGRNWGVVTSVLPQCNSIQPFCNERCKTEQLTWMSCQKHGSMTKLFHSRVTGGCQGHDVGGW